MAGGCSGGAAPAAPATTPAPAPTVTITATTTVTPTPEETEEPEPASDKVDSLNDLYKRLQSHGLTCDEYEVIAKNLSSSCDDGQQLLWYNAGGKKKTRFFHASMYYAWGVIQDQKRDDIAILVGENWFLRIGLTDAKTLHNDYHMGSTILTY
jgi:hypothetical protein